MIPIRDTVPSRSTPVVTWTLIAVNVAVFFYELTLGPQDLERFLYLFGMVPARYSHPEWARWVGLPIDNYWPFLTSMFLHGGWAHIIGNMWTLWIFGDNVEDRMGRGRVLLLYLVGGFAAGVVLHRLFLLPRQRRPRRWERDEYGVEGAWVRWR